MLDGQGHGYGSHAYALTCAHLGEPRVLPRSGVTVLVRALDLPAGSADACGPYPLLSTSRWRELAADLDEQRDLLSFVAVVDPMRAPGGGTLDELFPDRLLAYKTHHVARPDPRAPLAHVDKRHRRKADRALAVVDVGVASDPSLHAADWVRLYASLRRHRVLGAAADFPAAALAAQLELPGMMAVVARRARRVVSMSLWLVDGPLAYYHLGASDDEGYAAGAAFATFACALEALAAWGVERIDFGGCAGDRDGNDGLARFKRGWANDTRIAWLGGRVLDPARYFALAGTDAPSHYFPAYRARVAA